MLFFSFILKKQTNTEPVKKKWQYFTFFLILFFKTPHYVGIALCNHE